MFSQATDNLEHLFSLKIKKILHITNTMKKKDTSLPQVSANPTGAINYIVTDVRLKDKYVVTQFYP